MTSDRAAKKAARAHMAATGEPYLAARRATQSQPAAPAELAEPPTVDPQEHAIQSHYWGVLACHLVHYESRYYAWFTGPGAGARSRVYQLPSEEAGRHFVDDWQAANVLHTPWNEAIARIFLLDPAAGTVFATKPPWLDVVDSTDLRKGIQARVTVR